MATYSVGTTGVAAGYVTSTEILKLPDDYVSNAGTLVAATNGGMQNAMRLGVPMLVKNPDGSQSWYELDAERSTPSVPVLLKVPY